MATPRIVRTKDTLHGKPRVENTRWPTETVVGFNYQFYRIAAQYPHLHREQIEAAIRYEQRLTAKT